MADKSAAGNTRRPILDALDVRSSIAGDVWHTHMPLDIRVAIDHARFRQERDRKGRPFHAQHDLQIATIDRIAMHLPLLDLDPVLDRATEAMGFDHENVDQVVSTDVEGPLFETGDATPSARRSPPPPSRAASKRVSRPSAPATTRTPTADAESEAEERLSGERLSTRVA